MTKTNNATSTLCTAYREVKSDRKKRMLLERIIYDAIALTAPIWFHVLIAYSNWAIPVLENETVFNQAFVNFLLRAYEVMRNVSNFMLQCYAYRLGDTGVAPLVIFASGILFISYIEWGIREAVYYYARIKEFKTTKN